MFSVLNCRPVVSRLKKGLDEEREVGGHEVAAKLVLVDWEA